VLVDSKLIAAMYRLIDLLEAVEANMRQQDGTISIESILSCNKAREAVYALEAMAGINVKQFLVERAEKGLAKLTRSGLQ
jgi:hypothetical protein